MTLGTHIITPENAFLYKISFKTEYNKDSFNDISEDITSLLDKRVDLNTLQCAAGKSIVHICTTQDKTNWLRGIVTACEERGKPLDLTVRDPNQSYTALHFACFRNATTMLQYLLESGKFSTGDINHQAKGGLTAAHIAAGMPYDELSEKMLTLLKNHGANLTLKDIHGKTPHDIRRGLVIFDKTTGQNYIGYNKLHSAAFSKSIEGLSPVQIKTLIIERDLSDKTPLFYLIYSDTELLNQLKPYITREITNTQESNTNKTPLFYAAFYSSLEVNKFLLDCGADPRLADINGITPEAVAKMYGREEIVALYEKHLDKFRLLPFFLPYPADPQEYTEPKQRKEITVAYNQAIDDSRNTGSTEVHVTPNIEELKIKENCNLF